MDIRKTNRLEEISSKMKIEDFIKALKEAIEKGTVRELQILLEDPFLSLLHMGPDFLALVEKAILTNNTEKVSLLRKYSGMLMLVADCRIIQKRSTEELREITTISWKPYHVQMILEKTTTEVLEKLSFMKEMGICMDTFAIVGLLWLTEEVIPRFLNFGRKAKHFR